MHRTARGHLRDAAAGLRRRRRELAGEIDRRRQEAGGALLDRWPEPPGREALSGLADLRAELDVVDAALELVPEREAQLTEDVAVAERQQLEQAQQDLDAHRGEMNRLLKRAADELPEARDDCTSPPALRRAIRRADSIWEEARDLPPVVRNPIETEIKKRLLRWEPPAAPAAAEPAGGDAA